MSSEATDIAVVRENLKTSGDPRAERTRQGLFDAAARLCADNREVSVSAITRELGVSRSVFYTHFADVSDLALRMQEPLFADIAATASVARTTDPHAAMLDSQRRLVGHFAQHRALYRAALRLPGVSATHRIQEAMEPPIAAHISEVGAPRGVRADIASRYIASAAAHLLAAWILDEIEADEETIANHLYALMPPWMHGPTNHRQR